MDEDEIETALRGDEDEMNQGDIPKSTLAVAAVLWSILFAMQAWHLITTINMQGKQVEQGGDIRVMTIHQSNISDDVKDLKAIVASHESRLSTLEREK